LTLPKEMRLGISRSISIMMAGGATNFLVYPWLWKFLFCVLAGRQTWIVVEFGPELDQNN